MWPGLILGVGGSIATGMLVWTLVHGPRCRFGKRCRVAIVGDSLSAHGGYVSRMAEGLPSYTFDNYSQVGAGTGQILSNLQRALSSGNRYDEIIIEGGLNDWNRGDEHILNGLESLVRTAKASGARVVLLSLSPWYRGPQRIVNLNRRLRWLSLLWGADTFVDIWSPLADSSGALRSDLTSDTAMRIHPHAEGQRVLGEAILRGAY